MSYARLQSNFIYRSTQGTSQYRFTVYHESGRVGVRDIVGPTGPILDPYTQIPSEVMSDMTTAIGEVRSIMGLPSAVSGTMEFSDETTKSVEFDTPLSSSSYRVYFSCSDFVVVRLVSKSVSGFTVESSAPFTGTLGYDVVI